MDLEVLRKFYLTAYERVMAVDPSVLVWMSDSWRAGALDGYGFIPQRPNIVVEVHIYQLYLDEEIKMTPDQHNAYTRVRCRPPGAQSLLSACSTCE